MIFASFFQIRKYFLEIRKITTRKAATGGGGYTAEWPHGDPGGPHPDRFAGGSRGRAATGSGGALAGEPARVARGAEKGVQRGRRLVLVLVGWSAWPAVGGSVVGGEAPRRPSFGVGERAGE